MLQRPPDLLQRLLVLGLAVPLVAGCAGRSCGDLPELRAERDAARKAYVELTAGSAAAYVTEQADEELHALEGRVYDLEQSCA